MQCRVCDATELEPVLDLGNQPWCNHFLRPEEVGSEPFYPLRVVYCHRCATAQLDHTVKKEVMFGDHTYLSGVTRSLSDHFRTVADEVNQRIGNRLSSKSVLDIGSNDGTQLKHFQSLGYDVLGVESSKTTANIANEAGVPTVNEFFNLETSKTISRKFDVINAAGVFFHLEELHSVTEGIRESLSHEGIFVVQFLYMKRIIENLAFDQIYHEHLLYYNLKNIEALLNRHGLAMFDAYLSPIHGGSMIGFVTHQDVRPSTDRLNDLLKQEDSSRCNDIITYRNFSRRVDQMKQRDLAYLDSAKTAGKKIFGMGAPVKGNTLLNYFGIGKNYLECLVEKNRLRKGLVSPGMHLPVVMEDELSTPPDVYYVLAWNFKKEILANNKPLLDRGTEFYFPVDAGAA
ncbi:MAG: class I SAM-dependent methyltransferase [Gemmataceae bacterium]|nr:class I SAM-dependent methyltransferase [Gemmataceae bacterium]